MPIYLLINILVFLFPFLFSFDRKVHFIGDWFRVWPAILLTATLFIPWDISFTQAGIWGFNQTHLTGFSLAGLPIEEWLFFITIPYACLFSHQVLKVWLPLQPNHRYQQIISYTLLPVFLSLALLFFDKRYSVITFSAAAVFIFLLERYNTSTWLLNFYRTYLLVLVPFTLVNGLLTGSMLKQPIVWYNNAETMNLRYFTIPLEDTVYGFLLIGINISLFEYLGKRFKRSHLNERTDKRGSAKG